MTSPALPVPETKPAPTWCASHLVLTLLLCGFFLYVSHRPLWYTEVWGHLKFGQWISAHGQLPATEPFLPETDKTTPIVHFSWLAQISFYQVYSLGERLAPIGEQEAGGVEALRLLHGLLFAARMFFLYLAFVHVSRSRLVSVAGLVFVFFLTLPGIDPFRPQVWAEMFFALMLIGLSLSRLSNRAFFALNLLLVIWANVHGSFMIGLLVMGGANGGQFLQACREAGGVKLRAVWRYEPFRRLFQCIMMSMLCIGLLNPAGFGIFREALAYSRHSAVSTLAEWQPVAADATWSMAFFASLLFVSVTFVAGIYLLPRQETKRMLIGGIPLGQVLLLLFFGLRTISSQRYVTWWMFLIVWISMSVWGPLWLHWRAKCGWQGWTLRPSLAMLVVAGFIATAVMFSGVGSWLLHRRPQPMMDSVHPATPWQLAEQLRQPTVDILPSLKQWLTGEGRGGFRGRIFTSAELGDYLLWSLPAEQAPLLYAQVHLFPSTHWEACRQVLSSTGDWEAMLTRMDARIIFVEAESHPELRQQLLLPEHQNQWRILVDETGDERKPDPRSRWLLAIRIGK